MATTLNTNPYEFLSSFSNDQDVSARLDELKAEPLKQLAEQSDVLNCLPITLMALGWTGPSHQLQELLQQSGNRLDFTDIRNLFARLGYVTTVEQGALKHLDFGNGPALFIPNGKKAAMVLFQRTDKTIFAWHGIDEAIVELPLSKARMRGTLLKLKELSKTEKEEASVGGWMRRFLRSMRGLVFQTLGTTLLTNMLALATPLFVMAVYDKVIGSQSHETLIYMSVGVVLALLFELILRQLRTRTLAYAGGRLNFVAGNAVFNRLLHLPPSRTERAGLSSQIARLRDIDRVRSVLSGPLATAVLDTPFVIIFIFTIYLLAGALAFVPLVALVIYLFIALVLMPAVERRVTQAAIAGSKRQELVMESIEKMHTLRVTGAESIWLKRFDELSRNAARANFRSSQLSSLVATLSQSVAALTGLATLTLGIHLVLSGDLTTGGLITSMILVWRILAPLQGGFIAMSRMQQLRSSIKQVNTLMQLEPEREEHQVATPVPSPKGAVEFNRVTFRYGRSEPELINVSFSAKPGELVAIMGANGSGKSTVLKLINGLYQTQSGSIRIDGHDIRQFDPLELRHMISYVTQVPELFEGSIAENLRLVNLSASDDELWAALEEAGVAEEIRNLPDGLETLIVLRRPQTLSNSTLTRLSLARAYLRKAPIYLFDEPINGLDFKSEFTFINALHTLRGKATVFINTHRPGHIRIADKVLVMDGGAVSYFGSAEKLVKRMNQESDR